MPASLILRKLENISNWWTFLFLHFPFCFNLFLNYIINIYFLSPYSFVTANISIYICTCTQKRILRRVPSVQALSWFTQPFALFSQVCWLRLPPNYAEYQGKYAIIYVYWCSFIHLLRCLKGLYKTFTCSLQIKIRGTKISFHSYFIIWYTLHSLLRISL